MDDFGGILIHIMGLVGGDSDCGTSHWSIGCRGGIISAVDSVDKD